MRAAPLLLTAALVCAALPSCAPPRVNATVLTAEDMITMTDRMTQSLSLSAPIAARAAAVADGRGVDPWVVTLDRVVNRTEQPMTDAMRWGTMARFRALLSQTDLAERAALTFIAPRDEWQRHAAESYRDDLARLTPTHALRAVFNSDTVSSLEIRSDAYLCAFQLIDLGTGELIWEDAFETRSAVLRNRFD